MKIKKETTGISVDEFFTDFAMKPVGRRKVLDTEFKDELIKALDMFLSKRHRNMTADEFVNIPPPKCDDIMSEFANWAKKTLKIDVYQNFDDYYMRDHVSDTDHGMDEFDEPAYESKKTNEGSGSKVIDQYGIFDFIDSELADCEWVKDAWSGEGNDLTLKIETIDGDKYDITIKKADDELN